MYMHISGHTLENDETQYFLKIIGSEYYQVTATALYMHTVKKCSCPQLKLHVARYQVQPLLVTTNLSLTS